MHQEENLGSRHINKSLTLSVTPPLRMHWAMDPTPPPKKEKGRTGLQASEPTPGHPGSGHFLSRTRNLASALWVPGRNDSGSGPLPAGSERKEPGRRGPEQAQRPVSRSHRSLHPTPRATQAAGCCNSALGPACQCAPGPASGSPGSWEAWGELGKERPQPSPE